MSLNRKELSILEELNKSIKISLTYFAEKYNVSERNIRYSIENLNYYLLKFSLAEIKIKKGENVVGKNLRSLSAQKQKEFLEALTKVYFVSAVVTTIFVIITIILLIFTYNTTKQKDEEYYNGYNNTDDDYKDNYLNQIYNENINNKQENNYNDLSSTEYDRDYNNNYSNDNIFKDNNDNQNDDDRPRRGKHF